VVQPVVHGATLQEPTLHVEVHPGNGPHLLLVHGLFSARSHWLPNLEGLRTFSTPVVIELLGHGRSPAPDDIETYHPDWYVGEFERIRAWLGAEQWHVCGQSLGGALTLRYALRHPERVPAQVFTNSATAFSDTAWGEQRRADAERALAGLDPEDRGAIARSPMNPANNPRLPDHVREALRADTELHSPRGIVLTRLGTVPYGSVRDEVAANLVPTLMLVGRFERAFEEPRRFCEARMPLVETVELDAGHGVNLDQPEEFNAALGEFFARHPC
jgi:2-succinyl-6-hydroxy-2,4-cyclohexadiene-1-carboxylate synthase